MEVTFGELKSLGLRQVWSSESGEFTPWLADNIDLLGEAMGLELELVRREAAVGDFAVDLLARDLSTDRYVIVENQYDQTDHDHLGKLITYAAGFDAMAVIWLAESIREEHRQALEWLNQRTDTDTHFFGVVAQVLQIDDSRPATNFRLVVFPNEWQKTTRGGGTKPPSPKGEAYRAFFQELIDDLREQHRFTRARVARPRSVYKFSSGFSGVRYGAGFALGARARVEVYIDRGNSEENKDLYDWLAEQKAEIEQQFGGRLSWERLDERRASRIAAYRRGAITDSDDVLDEIRAWMIDQLLSVKKVFSPLLNSY